MAQDVQTMAEMEDSAKQAPPTVDTGTDSLAGAGADFFRSPEAGYRASEAKYKEATTEVERMSSAEFKEVSGVKERFDKTNEAWRTQAKPPLEKAPAFEPYKVTPQKWTAFAAFAAGMALLFGAGAGARGAMSALTGAFKGFHEGNLEAAKQKRDEFNANMEAISQRNQAILADWNAARVKHKDDVDGLLAEGNMIAATYKIPLAEAYGRQGDAVKLMQSFIGLEKAQEQQARMHDQFMLMLGFRHQQEENKQAHAGAKDPQALARAGMDALSRMQQQGTLKDAILAYRQKKAQGVADGGNPTLHKALTNVAALQGPGADWAASLQTIVKPDESGFFGFGASKSPDIPPPPGGWPKVGGASSLAPANPAPRGPAPAPPGVTAVGVNRATGQIQGSDGKVYPAGTNFGG